MTREEIPPKKGILDYLRDWGIAALLVSPCIAFFTLLIQWGVIPAKVEAQEKAIERHESMLNDQNTQLAVIQNNIEYIKEKVKKL